MKWSEQSFKHAAAVLVLVFATVLCYMNTWWNSFVYDDHVYVEQNPLVVEPLDLKKIFTSSYPPATPDQGLYRPLLTLSYKVHATVFGFPARPDAFNGFLFANTLMHLACVLLAFFLFLRLRLELPTAFGAALLFAVHPILSESVAWTVGRAEIGAALWTLVVIHLLWCGRTAVRFLALAAWLGALMFKESAIMAPALAWVLAAYRPESFPKLKPRAVLLLGAGATALLGFYAGLRSIALPQLVPSVTPFLGVEGPSGQIATAVTMLWKYLIFVFLPIPLSVFHDLAPAHGLFEWRPLAALLGWACLVAALWKWRGQTRDWRFGLCWWIVALLPASNLFFPIGTLFAERFLYLPCLLLYVALAETVRRLLAESAARPGRHWARAPVTALVLIAAVCVGLFIRTARRNADWRNDLTLWESAIRNYPGSFVAAAPYASALSKASRYEEAMKYLAKSEDGLARSPKVYQQVFLPKLERLRSEIVYGLDRQKYFSEMQAGGKLILEGQPKAALGVFEALARKYPQFSESEESIGDIYFKLGNDLGAVQHYQKAVLITPDRAALFGKIAQTLARAGAQNQAIEMYERSLILDGKDPITNYNIAILWNDIKQADKAIYYMERAIESYSAFTAARLNLASLYKAKGRNDDAVRQLQEVLKIEPRNAEAQKLLRKFERKEKDAGEEKS